MDPIEHAEQMERELAYKLRGSRIGLTRADFSLDPDGDYDYREYCRNRGWPCTLNTPATPLTKTDKIAINILLFALLAVLTAGLAYLVCTR